MTLISAEPRCGNDANISHPSLPDGAELMRNEATGLYGPELESLTALQKQVLRMGPENAELVQQKARDLRGALLGDSA